MINKSRKKNNPAYFRRAWLAGNLFLIIFALLFWAGPALAA
jgi:hypothetical protein